MPQLAYKLFRVRKDGTLGSLFINRAQRIPVGRRVKAYAHRTDGFAYRPGWHACHVPTAPHLTEKGRRWYAVLLEDFKEHEKPPSQGGLWFTARYMTVLHPVEAVYDRQVQKRISPAHA